MSYFQNLCNAICAYPPKPPQPPTTHNYYVFGSTGSDIKPTLQTSKPLVKKDKNQMGSHFGIGYGRSSFAYGDDDQRLQPEAETQPGSVIYPTPFIPTEVASPIVHYPMHHRHIQTTHFPFQIQPPVPLQYSYYQPLQIQPPPSQPQPMILFEPQQSRIVYRTPPQPTVLQEQCLSRVTYIQPPLLQPQTMVLFEPQQSRIVYRTPPPPPPQPQPMILFEPQQSRVSYIPPPHRPAVLQEQCLSRITYFQPHQPTFGLPGNTMPFYGEPVHHIAPFQSPIEYLPSATMPGSLRTSTVSRSVTTMTYLY